MCPLAGENQSTKMQELNMECLGEVCQSRGNECNVTADHVGEQMARKDATFKFKIFYLNKMKMKISFFSYVCLCPIMVLLYCRVIKHSFC